jgi:hypothetical protein
MLGIGTSGFFILSATAGPGLAAAVGAPVALFAATEIGAGGLQVASVSGGLGGSALARGSLIGRTAEAAAEEGAGSTAVGLGRGTAGTDGGAPAFVTGNPIGSVIRQTIG